MLLNLSLLGQPLPTQSTLSAKLGRSVLDPPGPLSIAPMLLSRLRFLEAVRILCQSSNNV